MRLYVLIALLFVAVLLCYFYTLDFRKMTLKLMLIFLYIQRKIKICFCIFLTSRRHDLCSPNSCKSNRLQPFAPFQYGWSEFLCRGLTYFICQSPCCGESYHRLLSEFYNAGQKMSLQRPTGEKKTFSYPEDH